MSAIPFDDLIPDIPEYYELPFPNATKLIGIEVILKPDQVLYIPPYWWHSIKTSDVTENALSLSVVSPSWGRSTSQ